MSKTTGDLSATVNAEKTEAHSARLRQAQDLARGYMKTLHENGIIHFYECTDHVADTWLIRYGSTTVHCKSSTEVEIFYFGVNAMAQRIQKGVRLKKVRILTVEIG